jgi:hypothetical protein
MVPITEISASELSNRFMIIQKHYENLFADSTLVITIQSKINSATEHNF